MARSQKTMEAEYEEVEQDSEPLSEDNSKVARQDGNMEKNRWRNILPFDLYRFEHKDDADFYINASEIKFSDDVQGHHYIATQGPLKSTVEDFWAMVHGSETDTVIMLCRLEEAGREKCHQYWPSKAETEEERSLHLEHFTVTHIGEESLSPDYTIRLFDLTHNKSGETRRIRHYHYTAWPDFGVPKDPESLLAMRDKIRKQATDPGTDTPHIVHCSAGVGRTGTWCAIDVGLSHKDKEVKDLVKELRKQRVGMVQTSEQYQFVHRVLGNLETSPDASK